MLSAIRRALASSLLIDAPPSSVWKSVGAVSGAGDSSETGSASAGDESGAGTDDESPLRARRPRRFVADGGESSASAGECAESAAGMGEDASGAAGAGERGESALVAGDDESAPG